MESDLSCIEHKSLIERRRAIILEQCSQIIGMNDAARYNKGALKQLFSDQVSIFFFSNNKVVFIFLLLSLYILFLFLLFFFLLLL